MIRKLLILALTLITFHANAQNVTSGFYRVQNYGTKRYAYVNDCQGSINYQNTTADMSAIPLRTPQSTNRLIDPASVIYVKNMGGDSYNLESQSTGVYQIIGYYVSVVQGTNTAKQRPENCYWVQATFKGTTVSLWDGDPSGYYAESALSTTGGSQDDYRCWSVFPVSASTDEYLGIQPSTELQISGKYYKPYYLGFAFDFASAGMKAYYISDIKTDAVIIEECKGTVPAATPVIVECSSPNASDNRITPLYTSPANITGNRLAGAYFCSKKRQSNTERINYDPDTMRLLAVKDGRLQYITDTEHKYTTHISSKKLGELDCINANESYLPVPAGTRANLPVMTQEEYDSTHGLVGIEATTTTTNTPAVTYDLTGRTTHSTHGLHIQNGRKTIR